MQNQDYLDDYLLVYTLPELYEALDDKQSPTALGIQDYMESNPEGEGFGVMERQDSDLDYSVLPFTEKIGGEIRMVLARDIYNPQRLDNAIKQREQLANDGISTANSINIAVYGKGERRTNEQVQLEEIQKRGIWDRLFNRKRDVVSTNHADNESQRLIIQNQWKNLFRKVHMSTKVNVLASRVSESGVKLRQAKMTINEAAKVKVASNSGKAKVTQKDLQAKLRKYIAVKASMGTVKADSKEFTKKETEMFEKMLEGKKTKNLEPVKKTQISPELMEGLRRKREEEKNEPGHRHWYNPSAS